MKNLFATLIVIIAMTVASAGFAQQAPMTSRPQIPGISAPVAVPGQTQQQQNLSPQDFAKAQQQLQMQFRADQMALQQAQRAAQLQQNYQKQLMGLNHQNALQKLNFQHQQNMQQLRR